MPIYRKGKAYAIIYDDNYIYVPIKARNSPYTHTELGFCSLMPNFFGGTFCYPHADIETYDETLRLQTLPDRLNKLAGKDSVKNAINASLRKEIEEESQGKFTLSEDFSVDPSNRLILVNPDREDYFFYKIYINRHAEELSVIENIIFEGDVCLLDMTVGQADRKEHCCIIKVPKTTFTSESETQYVYQLVAFCETRDCTDDPSAKCCSVQAGKDDFYGKTSEPVKAVSETKKAFDAFFKNWHN